MSEPFSPFAVNPAQLTGLGGDLFQELIGRLLAAEVSGLAGPNVRTSFQANVGDRGVDAELVAATETEWVPAGNIAWQFKAGDLSPKECADELAGASWALEILRAGGKYRIVLGKALQPNLIADRERELRAKAVELALTVADDCLQIIDGNQLARWIEKFPSLARARALGGTGVVAIGFDRWKVSQAHQARWVVSVPRDDLRAEVLRFLGESAKLDLRIEGASGLGKTRGVMEALRGSMYEDLVLYVGDADDLSYPLIDHLTTQKRTAVLVIDECTRQRHKVFAEQLEVGSSIRLITIGDRDPGSTPSLPIQITPLPDEVIEQILVQNHPALWSEARRTVVANCAGNVRWALLLGDAVLQNPKANAGELVSTEGIRNIILGMLAGDTDFLAFSALALFSRYGFEGDKRAELELIASGLNIPVEQLAEANRKLEVRGLVTKHGRFRSVTPQPLAVLLASRGWEELGERILDSLLPTLDASLAERLFLRAADIGSSGPAAVALNRILGQDGPFVSLQAMAETESSRLLIQLAIICPDETTAHLMGLISDATGDELRELRAIRRNLVWALEKLVWHSSTFEAAADMLLRLALAENETFANSATGTWVQLFGAWLPATAAGPAARTAYLNRIAADPSVEVRKLAVSAADHALDVGSAVFVSGELQGGVIVEPRGTPKTYGDVWTYVKAAIALLSTATSDDDADVRDAATKSLIDALHPMLENEDLRDALFNALVALPDDGRRKLWTAINHLSALFDRVDTPEFSTATDTEHDTTLRRAGLQIMIARLPKPTASEELKVLAAAQRWEWADGELQRKIVDAANAIPSADSRGTILDLLGNDSPPEASYELGAALHAVGVDDTTFAVLVELARTTNIAGLVGYLYAAVQGGDITAFDNFLDGDAGRQLDEATRLTITVRGPKSDRGWDRVLDLMKGLPVREAVPRLFGWHVDVDEARIAAMLSDWIPRIETQQDYNAAVDVAAMMTFRRPPPLEAATEQLIADLVALRSSYGEIGQQSYDWVQLARRGLSSGDPTVLAENLVKQVAEGSLHPWEGSEERKLMQEVMTAAGPAGLQAVLARMDEGSWRLQMDFRGWITAIYPAADIIAWVEQDLGRARIVASLAEVAAGPPSELVQFLLSNFGNDDEISSSLCGDFVSGSWWGNESSHINGQIAQIETWIADPAQPPGVKRWAREVIAGLKRRRDVVLLQEAEEDR